MPQQPQRIVSFPTTMWTLLEQAKRDTGESRRRALTIVLQQYLPALRCHLLLERRIREQDVDDLLQCFVTEKVLAHDLMNRAEKSRGRFRNFLLKALNNFVSNRLRHDRSLKRLGDATVSLPEIIDRAPAPDQFFTVAWTQQVVAQAIDRMRAECEASGRDDVWGVFEGRILRPSMEGVEPVPYDSLVAEFQFASPSQASNVLITASRMFRRSLRGVIAEYADDPKAVEEEIADLRRNLSAVGAGYVAPAGTYGGKR